MKSVLCVSLMGALLLAGCATPPALQAPRESAASETLSHNGLNERISYYAGVYGVPESLVHQSIQRESAYNPAAHVGPFWGLMQIRLETARGMGYRGPARGLLDADTNLKYAVAYLSNAYLVAEGNQRRALALYASGYFYEARRKRLLDRLRTVQDD